MSPRIVIIGSGKMGLSHAALISAYIGKSNVFVCDTKLYTRLVLRILGFKTFKSLDHSKIILHRINAVTISTPTSSHYNILRWAIMQGINCFVEKPLTLNTKQNQELKQLSKRYKTYIQVGFVMRYNPNFQNLKKIICLPEIGQVLSYSASFTGNAMLQPPKKNSWRGKHNLGGGCLNEYGPHVIDLCFFIFGNIHSIQSIKWNKKFCYDADDEIEFSCSHENSTRGNVYINWSDNTKRKSVIEFKIQCSNALIIVDNSSLNVNWKDSTKIKKSVFLNGVAKKGSIYNVQYYLRGEEFSLQLEDFLANCYDNSFSSQTTFVKSSTPDLIDGCNVDNLIEQIALKSGLK